MSKSMDTICVHGKEHAVKDQNYAISYPIYQTASFSHLTPGHNPNGFDYTRESNPTRSLLEETVSALEGACDTVALLPEWLPLRRCLNISSRETM